MLEIKSKWKEIVNEDGVETLVFVLYMERGENLFNVAIDGTLLDDGDEVLNCLTPAINQLVYQVYPEMQDPIYRLHRRIVKLDEEKMKIFQMIKNIKKDDLVRFDEEEIKGVTE